MVEELPRYARTLARTGAPPSTVLLLDGDADRAARLAAVLEEANIRVVRSPLAKPVQELLDREVPDLLAVAPQLSDADGFSVVRMVRQDPRFHLLPSIVIGAAGRPPIRWRRCEPAPTTSCPTPRRPSCCSRP